MKFHGLEQEGLFRGKLDSTVPYVLPVATKVPSFFAIVYCTREEELAYFDGLCKIVQII